MKTSNIKYTFLLPAFKGRFLSKSLRSIQQQTYKNFKVIISDDCSPEDIKTICNDYLKDVRFSYRKNKLNIGGENLTDHWNLLLDLCDTEYLIMASDDDIYAESFLEKIDYLTQKYPHTDLIRARCVEMSESEGVILEDGLYPEFVSNILFIKQQYTNTNIGCIGNFVFKTQALKKKKGFIKFPYAWFSDDATAIMMAEKGCANTADALFQFRVSDISISYGKGSSIIAKKKIEATLLYDSWVRDFLKNNIKAKDGMTRRIMSIFYFTQQQWNEFHIYNNIYQCSLADFRQLCPIIKQHYIYTWNLRVNYYKRYLQSLGKR